ncbi:type 4a pilus biogenesis protein PilO [bacterium]|nr:type 4a pilus biogenesis protein PilO [bacterium]
MANSKKTLIVIALCLAVCVVYLFFFFQPKKVEIADLQVSLEKKRADMAEKQRIARDLGKFDRQVEELNLRLQQSLAQLPNEKEVSEILRLIAQLANISGIEMTAFTVMPEIRKALYAEVPIEIKLAGGFHNIAIFLDKVSKQDRIINISNLKLGEPQIVNGDTIVVATCTATAFRFLPGQADAPAPGGAS